MARPPSNRKVKGQAARTARLLLGKTNGRLMETPEEREHLALVLSRSHDARVQQLVTDLALQPGTSLARLAEGHGLNFHQISEEYTRLRKSEGFIRAAHHIPEIMEQVAVDAKNRWEECGGCNGIGMVDTAEGIKPCPARGCTNGRVYVQASIDHLKLMFDTFGLTGKGGGVNVNLDLRKTDQPETLHDIAGSLSGIIEGNTKP